MIDETADEQMAEREQVASDLGYDDTRDDIDPSIEICQWHGVYIPKSALQADCLECNEDARRPSWIAHEHLPARLKEPDAA